MSTNSSQKRKHHSDDDIDEEELRLAKERVRRLEEKIRLKKLQHAKERAKENVTTLKEKLELAELEFKAAAEAVEECEREMASQRKRRRREDEKRRYEVHMNYTMWLILTYVQRNPDNQLVNLEKVESPVGVDVNFKRAPRTEYAFIRAYIAL
jgi:hypothetical protein